MFFPARNETKSISVELRSLVEWVPLFLERPARQPYFASLPLAFSTIIFSFRSQNILDPLRTNVLLETLADATHRCRTSIRTLMGRFWARCMLGFDRKPRSITVVTNLGLLSAAI